MDYIYENRYITSRQGQLLWAACGDYYEIMKEVYEHFNIEGLDQLKASQFDEAIGMIQYKAAHGKQFYGY